LEHHYQIKELEAFSGIKAHTIRIWEKRYGLFNPERTDTNLRRYDGDDLRRLLNISVLLKSGFKISHLASLDDEELSKEIETVSGLFGATESASEGQIQLLIKAMVTFDDGLFEKVFGTIILRFGLKDAFIKILYPFISRVGVLWCMGEVNPAQEHFITNLVKQKLFCAIDGLMPPTEVKDTWLLFLPEDEYHEIGLLMSYFLLKSHDKKVIYLGQNVPFENLKGLESELMPDHLLTFFVRSYAPEELESYQKNLANTFSNSKVYVASSLGNTFTNVPPNMHFLNSIDEFISVMN
jgi:DNA-binding transcriptional MerR regulator